MMEGTEWIQSAPRRFGRMYQGLFLYIAVFDTGCKWGGFKGKVQEADWEDAPDLSTAKDDAMAWAIGFAEMDAVNKG